MSTKKQIKLISIPVFPIALVIYYYFIKLNIIHAGSFYFRVFPLPLTLIVILLQTFYLILACGISFYGVRVAHRKKLRKYIVYMLSAALLYTIVFSLKVAFGVYFTTHDVVLSVAMMLLPLIYYVCLTSVVKPRRRR